MFKRKSSAGLSKKSTGSVQGAKIVKRKNERSEVFVDNFGLKKKPSTSTIAPAEARKSVSEAVSEAFS